MENGWIIMREDWSFRNEFPDDQRAVEKYETYMFLVSVLYLIFEHPLDFFRSRICIFVTMEQLTK